MTRQIFTIILSLLISVQLHSQRTKINLDKTVFIKSIANSAWSLEDKTKKKDEEMFIMSFKDNILSIAYVDWIEGIYGSNTKYKLLFKDSIMEITPTSWKTTKGSSKKKDKKPPFVIYCYLQSTEKIVVLFKDERSEHFTKLLGDNEWLELTKFEK